jgi:hypothetical protein
MSSNIGFSLAIEFFLSIFAQCNKHIHGRTESEFSRNVWTHNPACIRPSAGQ